MTFAAMGKRKKIRISKSRVENMAFNDTIQHIFKEGHIMKTIEEIMKVTGCDSKTAKILFNELTKLPEEIGNYMSDHLDVVDAVDAVAIGVDRLTEYSKYDGRIMVKRVNKKFPTYLDGTPNYDHWKYCFDCLIDYVGVSAY